MKNDRKIEVGQVREIYNCKGTLYFIKRINKGLVFVNIIQGEDVDKGKSFTWDENIVREDMVVM